MKNISSLSGATIALMIVAVPLLASAHERRVYQIGNKDYILVIGFLDEPVMVDDKAGVDLSVMLGNGAPTMGPDGDMDGPPVATQPVSGLEKDLKVEVSAGSEKKIFDFAPAYGALGHYRATFYPSVATTYAFRITGKMNNVSVDISFSCNASGQAPEANISAVKLSDGVTQKMSSGTFGCPSPKADQIFPAQQMTLATLDQKVASHGTKVTLAMVFGILGMVLSMGMMMRSRK